ncbi:MAG: 3-methyl-2-oxobutanoate hydroxymethyltransferase [Candidatus Aureabacteria bacterium]|nr:3-methyl-2-oxobutanoate hydroxymethyltransferase [Candidatus Auribacterota bacterium]NLW95106.1 3-methyl-2-oxobutanoate hydroxymethyltransferase [Chlamydiota bacterium]HOE26226.1 3-methyl-2-oxobutanoate hydroxymethyltransferase [bacterium]HQM53200.1 3-methyl-2-oxobutanoate hydroxymethyltransferase [bacterium]
MTADKITPLVLREMKKRGEKIVALTAYDFHASALLNDGGVDLILVGDSLGMVLLGYPSTLPVTMEEMLHHTRAVARGNSRALLVGDMPFMAAGVRVEETVRNAGRFVKEAGAHAVKIEGGEESAPEIRAVVRAGVPVLGHIGLTPQDILVLGGYRVQGRGDDAARRVEADARAVEEAGAFAIVLECLPAELAARVTASVGIPTIGIGAGPSCDGQILVLNDILGLSPGRAARFVKVYADLGKGMREAVSQYAAEVRTGRYPDAGHSYR